MFAHVLSLLRAVGRNPDLAFVLDAPPPGTEAPAGIAGTAGTPRQATLLHSLQGLRKQAKFVLSQLKNAPPVGAPSSAADASASASAAHSSAAFAAATAALQVCAGKYKCPYNVPVPINCASSHKIGLVG